VPGKKEEEEVTESQPDSATVQIEVAKNGREEDPAQKL